LTPAAPSTATPQVLPTLNDLLPPTATPSR
jgi:hypothetical protein